MSRYLLFTLFLVTALLQTQLPPLTPWRIKPDLVMLAVVSAALASGLGAGTAGAALGGIASDLASALPLGSSVVSLLPVVLLGHLVGKVVMRSNPIAPLAAAILGSWSYYAVLFVVMRGMGSAPPLISTVQDIVLPATALNLLFLIPIYPLTRWAAGPRGEA